MSYPQLQGASSQLIRQPGDTLTEARNGLATLVRSYWCALSYADTARSVLVKGYVPSDYPYMGLFNPPNETVENGIAKFQCTFYGVLSTSKYYQPYDQIEATLADGSVNYIDTAAITLGETAGLPNRPLDSNGVPLDVITTDAFQYAAPTLIRSFVVPASDGFSFNVPTLSDFQGVPISEFNSVITKGASVNSDMRPIEPQRIVTATGRTIASKRALISDYGVVRVIEVAYELTVSPEVVVVGPGTLTGRPIYVNQTVTPCTIPVTSLTNTHGGPTALGYTSGTGVVGANSVRVSLSWGIPSSPAAYPIVGYQVTFQRKYVGAGIAGTAEVSNDTFFTKTGGPVYPSSTGGITGYEPGVYECSVASHNVYGSSDASKTSTSFVQAGGASLPRGLTVSQEIFQNVPPIPNTPGAVSVSWGTPYWDGISNEVNFSPNSDAAIIDYKLVLGSTTHTIPVSSLTSGNHVIISAESVGEIVSSASLTARTAAGYGATATAAVTPEYTSISGG